MAIVVDVWMKAAYIFDFTLHQTYAKLSGFLTNLAGLSVIIIGGMRLRTGALRLWEALAFVALGICIIAWTPLMLYLRARKLAGAQKYHAPIRYSFDTEGITERMGDHTHTYLWSQVAKAVSTPKTIAFFLSETEALIVPKENFRENFMPVMKLIFGNLTRDQIYIR